MLSFVGASQEVKPPVQRASSLFYKKEALSHLAISVFRREQGGELPGLPGEF